MVNIKIITYIVAVVIVSLFAYLTIGSSARDSARTDFDKFNQRKANININDSKGAGGRQW